MQYLVDPYIAGFKHQAPAHNAQEGKVDFRYLVWCPSSRTEKYFACSADSCRVFHCTNCTICISKFQMAQAAPPLVRTTTWYFTLRLQMPDFSTAEEVQDVLMSLRSAPFSTTRNKQSLDWKTSLFLMVCRKAVSHIFADICTPRARLQKPMSKAQGWFSDSRIPPETTCWTRV